jgi:hypothetical protein
MEGRGRARRFKDQWRVERKAYKCGNADVQKVKKKE